MTPSPLFVAAHRAPAPSGPAHRGPRLSPPEWLLGLDDDRFAHQVSQDVRGLLREERAEGLRDPRLLERWASVLRGILDRIEHNLEHFDQSDPEFWAWSTRTATFRKHAMRRLAEAERLLTEGGAR